MMSDSTAAVSGHPVYAAGVIGSFSLALSLLLHALAVFEGVESSLLATYRNYGFLLESGGGQPIWGLWLVGGLVYLLPWVVFETPGTQRRLLVVVATLLLLALTSPVLGLWQVFWSPVAALVASAWAGFCSLLWASHHCMPCESDSLDASQREKIVAMKEEDRARRKQS